MKISTRLKDIDGKEIFEGDTVFIEKQKQWFLVRVIYERKWARFVGKVIKSNRGNKNVTLNNTTEMLYKMKPESLIKLTIFLKN